MVFTEPTGPACAFFVRLIFDTLNESARMHKTFHLRGHAHSPRITRGAYLLCNILCQKRNKRVKRFISRLHNGARRIIVEILQATVHGNVWWPCGSTRFFSLLRSRPPSPLLRKDQQFYR